jgi:hypothetical protein
MMQDLLRADPSAAPKGGATREWRLVATLVDDEQTLATRHKRKVLLVLRVRRFVKKLWIFRDFLKAVITAAQGHGC